MTPHSVLFLDFYHPCTNPPAPTRPHWGPSFQHSSLWEHTGHMPKPGYKHDHKLINCLFVEFPVGTSGLWLILGVWEDWSDCVGQVGDPASESLSLSSFVSQSFMSINFNPCPWSCVVQAPEEETPFLVSLWLNESHILPLGIFVKIKWFLFLFFCHI
jgi:hypothetical protein